MKRSKLGSINFQDLGKSLVTSVLAAVLVTLYEFNHTGGELNLVSLKNILAVGVTAGLADFFKKLGTNSKGKILAKEEKK